MSCQIPAPNRNTSSPKEVGWETRYQGAVEGCALCATLTPNLCVLCLISKAIPRRKGLCRESEWDEFLNEKMGTFGLKGKQPGK